MDISKASTRAFSRLHQFHERLNRSIKTAAVALNMLDTHISTPAEEFIDLKKEASSAGDLWGGMPDWGNRHDSSAAIQLARHDLGASGVIRAYSAFDVFMETLQGELQTWRLASKDRGNRAARRRETSRNVDSAAGAEDPEDDDEDDPKVRVLRIYERENWPLASVEFLLPIYTYFRLLRNCVAHSDAVSTPALESASQSRAWKKSIDVWRTKTADLTMPLPQLAPTGTPIRISHKEAILASSLLRMLAWDMTRHAVVELGEEGLLYVLVSRILKERPPGLVGGKSFFGKLHAHLKLVHRVEGLESKRTRVILERFEMWDEWRAWHLAST